MKPPYRLAMGLTAISLTVGLAGCSSNGSTSSTGTSPSAATSASVSASDCGQKLLPASPAAALPGGFPSPTGAVFYQLTPVGATKVHFAYIAGSDVVQTRDAIKAQLVAAGFTIKGSDQEDNVEADLDGDSAAHGGTVQVIHYCTGYLRLRYSLDH